METIYIQKQTQADGTPVFTVSAVKIQTPQGKVRGVPHPYGKETTVYPSLESALEAVHRAGYDAECEGRFYPLPPHQTAKSKAASKPVSRSTQSLQQILAQSQSGLLALLNDTNPGVVANAAFALGELRDAKAVGALIGVFRHDDATVRKQAAEAVAKLGQPALRPLEGALRDSHWLVRHSALTAMVDLVALDFGLVPSVLPHVLPLLQDDNWLVRSQAALVLAESARMHHQLESSN